VSHLDFLRRILYNAKPINEVGAERLLLVCEDLERQETVRLCKLVQKRLNDCLNGVEDIEKQQEGGDC